MPGHSSLPCADCVNLSAMPGIHVFLICWRQKTWMAGTSPAMTKIGRDDAAAPSLRRLHTLACVRLLTMRNHRLFLEASVRAPIPTPTTRNPDPPHTPPPPHPPAPASP